MHAQKGWTSFFNFCGFTLMCRHAGKDHQYGLFQFYLVKKLQTLSDMAYLWLHACPVLLLS